MQLLGLSSSVRMYFYEQETEFLEKEHLKPWVCLRSIDDIFFAWIYGENELDKFLERLNSFHPNLKITSECSREEINFIDVTVKLNNNQFVTDHYYKPTDYHQYLHDNSFHPDHMKKSSVYNQGLRIKSLCRDATSLINQLKNLRSWFCSRVYPLSMVKEQLKRAENRTNDKLLCTNSCIGKEVGVPLISSIIHTLIVCIKQCRKILNISKPMRRLNWRLHQHLFYHFAQRVTSAVIQFDLSFNLYNVRLVPANEILLSAKLAKRVFHSCNSKNLFYLIFCKVCGKQYVGSKAERFRFQWNNYKSSQRKAERGEDSIQKYLRDNFLSEGYNSLINDIEIIFIDKTDPSDPTRRERILEN